jgi:hypothetical protein
MPTPTPTSLPTSMPSSPIPAADVAVTRKMLEGNATIIAVVPAGAQVESWPLLLRLAQAIQLLRRGRIALVRGPDLEAPARTELGRPGPGEVFRILDLDADGSLAELILPPAVGLAESANHLERALERARGLYAHVLLGYEGYIPDVHEALQIPDVFVSAARAGHTRETDLAALVQQLPPSRHLGTLLVD